MPRTYFKYTLFAFLINIFCLGVLYWPPQIHTPIAAPLPQVQGLQTNLDWLLTWQRPPGPPRVALQVGHWKNDQLPEELDNIRGNTGTHSGDVWEWEVNLDIAQRTQQLLESQGIVVDLLPSTVPPRYWADVFLAIHIDGSPDASTNGYKFVAPRKDHTQKSHTLVETLSNSYQAHTQFNYDPNITRNMTGYYAFSWRKYQHAIHPMTTAAIAELGFLTNPSNRSLLTQTPDIPAQALAEGITKYLQAQNLLPLST